MESASDNHDLDLPLSANIRDVEITHFLLHLTCDMEQKSLSGDITLFCHPAKDGVFINHRDSETRKIDTGGSGDSNDKIIGDCVKNVNQNDEMLDKSFNNDSVNITSLSSDSLYQCCLKNNTENLNHPHEIPSKSNLGTSETTDSTQRLHCQDSEPVQEGQHPMIILDSHTVDVSCVEELVLSPVMKKKLSSATREDIESKTGVYMQCYTEARAEPLDFSLSKHSLRIWRNSGTGEVAGTRSANEIKSEAGEFDDRTNTIPQSKFRESMQVQNECASDQEKLEGFQMNHCDSDSTISLCCDSQVNEDVLGGEGEAMSDSRVNRKGEVTVGVAVTREKGETLVETKDKGEILGETKDKSEILGETKLRGEMLDETKHMNEMLGETKDKGERLGVTEHKGEKLGEIKDKSEMLGETKDKGEMFDKTKDKGEIPRVVRIKYTTRSCGPSLKWTLDQDGRPCMFTVGHWLNNRSWFPSQDAPSAMPTWQALVTVANNLSVLMSGDQSSQATVSQGQSTFFYYTTMPMPTSTLAIAVGSWKQIDVTPKTDRVQLSPPLCSVHGSTCIVNYSTTPDLPCRVFVSESLRPVVEKELVVYIPKCLREVHGILGHHPFQRLDVLVVPPCFDSLGMASPNLLLLSQSLLVGDSTMCARVAHEICHSWFGLLIGPSDWTEEWLTEGFCTYLEDILHARVCQWDETERFDHLELRALLKQKTLMSEVENTEEALQKLRPNQGKQLLPDNDSVQYVKNGMNPDKGFMQVHYLKGFFLLRHLQNKVGLTHFLHFLHQYVIRYHAQLVTSQDFLDFFFKTFHHLRQEGMSENQLISDWLDFPGVPQEVRQFTPKSSNRLWKEIKLQASHIQSYCGGITSNKNKKKRKIDLSGLKLEKLHTDQLVLLLEDLLLLDHIPAGVLDLVLHTYQLSAANPEIRHRWCELVIKHRHKQGYKDVQHFLIHDQAMGVYLYGEMILSGCKKQKELALHCFEITGQDMPEGAYKTVHSMLYGR